MPRFVLLILIVAGATGTRASSLSAQGHASAPPDRAVVLLFMRCEAHPDGSSDQQLANSYAQAKTWLNNFGVKDEQITLRPLVTRMFQDQKRYLLQRMAITIPLEAGKPERTLAMMAQLIDQAGARGLLPMSQLAMLSQEQENMPPSMMPDAPNHFIFYLPADAKGLLDRAIQDGLKTLRAENARLAAAAHREPPKLTALHTDNTQIAPMDLKAGQLGLASTTLSDIQAYVQLSADFDVAEAKGQSLTTSGAAHVQLPPQRATVQARISCPDVSLQKSLDRIAEKTQQFQAKVTPFEGAKTELGGIALFSGNPGMGSAEPVEGAVPSGCYRDIRVTMERQKDEEEAAFRKRVETLAAALHPSPNPDDPNLNNNPFFQVTWSPKETSDALLRATQQAIDDATVNARHVASALGAKLGAIVDIESSPVESQIAINGPYSQSMGTSLPNAPEQVIAASHLDEPPTLNVTLQVKFAAEIP